MPRKTPKRCLYPDCDEPQASGRRGCCESHYGQLWRAIKAGETTNEELVKLGWFEPSQRGKCRLGNARRKLAELAAASL